MLLRSLVFAASLIAAAPFAIAQPQQAASMEELFSGVLRIKAFIDPEGRTVANLGAERDGTGIAIDNDGLVLTIGYLIVEAYAAEIVTNDGRTVQAEVIGYDHDTGFGLLRASAPLKVRALPLGKSGGVAEGDTVVFARHGGLAGAAPLKVVSRREFAGSWEYLLDDAIYTSPPQESWSGAALIDRNGTLVGIGSLIVNDASGKGDGSAGNMFVPIDKLAPVMADLIASGRPGGVPRPWLGLNTVDLGGRLLVNRVTAGGPAERAGIRSGDILIGVGGKIASDLGDFYRKTWALGGAGTMVPIDVLRDDKTSKIEVRSMNRLDHLKLKSSF